LAARPPGMKMAISVGSQDLFPPCSWLRKAPGEPIGPVEKHHGRHEPDPWPGNEEMKETGPDPESCYQAGGVPGKHKRGPSIHSAGQGCIAHCKCPLSVGNGPERPSKPTKGTGIASEMQKRAFYEREVLAWNQVGKDQCHAGDERKRKMGDRHIPVGVRPRPQEQQALICPALACRAGLQPSRVAIHATRPGRPPQARPHGRHCHRLPVQALRDRFQTDPGRPRSGCRPGSGG